MPSPVARGRSIRFASARRRAHILLGTAVVLALGATGVPPAQALGSPVDTPVGQSISISPADGAVVMDIHYAFITVAGTTTLRTDTAGPAPVGFTAYPDAPLYYFPTTTATFLESFLVCVAHLDDSTPVDAASPQRLLQFQNGSWVADASYSDRTRGCISTTSLTGPFMLGSELPGAIFPQVKYPNYPASQYLSGPDGAREIALRFPTVTVAGVSTLTTSATGPTPSGFTLDPEISYFYDLSTTAQFTGPVTVCVTSTVGDAESPTHLNLYSFDATWTEVTTYLGFQTVCGEVQTLGLMALGYPDQGLTPAGQFQPTIPLGQATIRTVQATFDTVSVAGTTTLTTTTIGPAPLGLALFSYSPLF